MNHRDPRDPRQGGMNRDFGARDYANTPSLTHRHADAGAPWGDSFGPAELGGYGNFAAPGDLEHVAGGQAIGNVTRRALARRAGKGPRNATRSDSLIAEELNERLTDDEQLDASEILVRVEDGHVLLAGEVRERWMKHRAEDIADAVRGVRDIDNRLRVDAGVQSFGTGGAVRAGLDQPGSGFSSSPPNR